jgi:hypothetical protein
VTDFHCKHCTSRRFIGRGEGTGKVQIQCKACGQWQWVSLDGDPRNGKAALAEARIA